MTTLNSQVSPEISTQAEDPPALQRFACSVMVIIDASQALDPGSIPGRRTRTFNYQNDFVLLG